ncbi:MAG: tRNA pseudouridine(38-40) synthase TruA [Ignavibacteriales bacterium]|nr:tRNA pseudouridine(38-40) synthase TruA [Ignavibacteriales bacterium]
MNNYKLTIQYDGTDFAGWQIQKNAPTIQQTIVDAIQIILKENVNLIGSGRTDAGVHALGQVANFKTENALDIRSFQYSLNSLLPESISILNMEKVDDNFNARYSAKSRNYFYFINSIKSPFYQKYSMFDKQSEKINVDQLNVLSKILLGEKDFTSFSKKDEEKENKNCIIIKTHWRRSGSFLMFYIEANRFLHGMVRSIVGTLLQIVKENKNKEDLTNILNSKNRENAGMSVSPKGLFLYKVKY